MPSPFPGMNPYLEQPSVWQDFHQSIITRIRDALSAQVRPQFFVKIEESVFIHESSAEERRKRIGRPDVAIFSHSDSSTPTTVEQVSNVTSFLVARIPDVDLERHAFVEIRDRNSRELVTMIEVFSPSNKHYGPDREQYLMKRTALLSSQAAVVEIDQLRGGPRLPIAGVPECDYLFMVSRPQLRPDLQAWPIRLRDPLPPIPIPLREPSPDATLDLKPLLDDAYDSAGYEDYLFETLPEPALSDSDLTWAQQQIASLRTPRR